MPDIGKLLHHLSSRLPELEWKVSGMSAFITTNKLPKGLFRSANELNGQLCIAEIKSDIQDLSNQTNHRAAFYRASQIEKKINVLVYLCQTYHKQSQPQVRTLLMDTISTRQQWIQSLETDISKLKAQRLALENTLEKSKQSNSAVVLALQSELGEVEKCLTLAQETLHRAIS